MNVTHTGLCHSDVFMATQGFIDFIALPLVPGHEVVGIVAELGANVTDFRVGERVAFGAIRDCCHNTRVCEGCATGNENFCPKRIWTYNPHFGGYSTSFQGNDHFFVKLPDAIPSEKAGPLMCAGITTYSPLARYVRPGMKVGIQGIGGLGHLALQFANKMGAEVTAISTSSGKEELVRSLGAHHFLNSRNPEEAKAAQASFDFVMITGSSYDLNQSLNLLKLGGTMVLIGIPNKSEEKKLDLFAFIAGGKTIASSVVGSIKETREMLQFAAVHNVLPMVEVFPFGEAQAAFNMLAHNNPRGPEFRCVLETESFLRGKGKL
jgi:D-arabinose 1-dehydrogenase-like Zn-dependent alcohol dehydrogenase